MIPKKHAPDLIWDVQRFRFTPKVTELLRHRKMTRWAQKRTTIAQLFFVENWTPSVPSIVLQANQSNPKLGWAL